MEMSTDERLQNAFGNLLALNDAVGALLRASPNKDVVETALAELSTLTLGMLHQTAAGTPLLQAYLDHTSALRNAMRPG